MNTENDAPPTCYRHPGRETHVRCTRCDRPICPDCMREAAVGHQCVECVAEGNRSVRQPRTVVGAPVAAAARPVVTYAIMGLCVLVYLAEVVSGQVINDFAMIGRWWDGTQVVGVAEGQWYRLFTAMFLHDLSPAHIALNMWGLWVLGPQLEQVLGRWRFLSLYLLSGLGGSVLVYLVDPTSATVGASGAIFGMFGAYFALARRAGLPTGGIVALIVINLAFTFVFPLFSGVRISWEAHIGGLVVGALVALAYAYAPRGPHQRTLHIVAVVGMLALLLAAVAFKTETLPPIMQVQIPG